jgi:hypothetical protein
MITIKSKWNRDNRNEIVSEILAHNTEIRIKISGKKLILRDNNVDYYSCVPPGGSIEIPIYEGCMSEDDLEKIEEEILINPICECVTPQEWESPII